MYPESLCGPQSTLSDWVTISSYVGGRITGADPFHWGPTLPGLFVDQGMCVPDGNGGTVDWNMDYLGSRY